MPDGVQVEEARDTYGRFVVQPLERGFGVTIGNALRRVLLSSLEGVAITAIKIDGVQHEFSTVPGVTEDVADIILNLKGVRFKAVDTTDSNIHLVLKRPPRVDRCRHRGRYERLRGAQSGTPHCRTGPGCKAERGASNGARPWIRAI